MEDTNEHRYNNYLEYYLEQSGWVITLECDMFLRAREVMESGILLKQQSLS